MIRSFNRRQRAKAVASLLTGMVAYGLAWAFFAVAAWQGLEMTGIQDMPWLQTAVPLCALLVITASGWKRHRSARETDIGDAVWWKGDAETAGAAMMRDRINGVSSSAWLLGSLFTAGPVGILRAVALWRSCLPPDPQLEQRMTLLLRELHARNQWVAADSFRDHWEPLSALIRTGQVEFSSIKGRVRASS